MKLGTKSNVSVNINEQENRTDLSHPRNERAGSAGTGCRSRPDRWSADP
jgi:hypothetical protein